MFETNTFNLQQSLDLNNYSQADRAAQASRKALQAFYNALTQGWWGRVWASLSNRPQRLLDLNDQALPLVDLIQIGETYFVHDGHHRISVAQALGQESIEAEVTVM